jgi:hypothetical protein
MDMAEPAEAATEQAPHDPDAANELQLQPADTEVDMAAPDTKSATKHTGTSGESEKKLRKLLRRGGAAWHRALFPVSTIVLFFSSLFFLFLLLLSSILLQISCPRPWFCVLAQFYTSPP